MAGNALTLNEDGTLDGVQMAIVNKRMEAICAKMANTLLRTGALGRAQQRTRLLLLHRDRGEPPAHGQREPADPRPARRRHDVRIDAGVSPRPHAGRRLPAQLALSRLLPPRRPPPRWCRWWTTRACTASPWWPRPIRPTAATPSPPPITAAPATCTRRAALIFPAVPDPARLRGHRGHRAHVPAPHPRAGPVVGRLSGGAGCGADRRARDPGLRPRDRLGHPRPVRRAVVRLQRAADDRRGAEDAGRPGRDPLDARPLPQRRGRHSGQDRGRGGPGRGDDRHRPARQPGCDALRPQPLAGLLREHASAGRLQRHPPTQYRPTPAPSAACACTCARTASPASPGTRQAARWRRPTLPTAWATRSAAPSPISATATAWRAPARSSRPPSASSPAPARRPRAPTSTRSSWAGAAARRARKPTPGSPSAISAMPACPTRIPSSSTRCASRSACAAGTS